MPHTETARKSLRQSIVRRVHNRAVIAELRTEIKKLLKAVKDGAVDAAKAQLSIVYKKLDKCGARRYLHPNTAYRYKSRLAKRVGKMTAPAPAQA